jgi:hypothetical protein
MNATQKNQAERVSRNAHISYPAAVAILGAARSNNHTQLAIAVEHYLMDGEQMEILKDRGLTILDCLTGSYDRFDYGIVDNIFAEWNERLGEQIFHAVGD